PRVRRGAIREGRIGGSHPLRRSPYETAALAPVEVVQCGADALPLPRADPGEGDREGVEDVRLHPRDLDRRDVLETKRRPMRRECLGHRRCRVAHHCASSRSETGCRDAGVTAYMSELEASALRVARNRCAAWPMGPTRRAIAPYSRCAPGTLRGTPRGACCNSAGGSGTMATPTPVA